MNEINIISFDVPYPANYGGVIDVFYKIKCFYNQDIKVHLHCFEYGRAQQKELNKYCVSVNYYKRKTGIGSQLSSTPYIVKSRTSANLKSNLLKNDFPILFEGLHCCFLLADEELKSRIKIVRAHNIEHDYYHQLAKIEKNSIKRKYFITESKKLQQFEPIIVHADLCLTVSETDQNYFKKKYPDTKFIHIPCFHANDEVKIEPGKGNYVLYHGNLSVSENINAIEIMVKKLFTNSKIPLKIAGLNPSHNLIALIEKHPNIELISNPTDEELTNLITNAQINFLYTDQATGLKLKLLNVLYKGRHCIVNSKMVKGTTLRESCLVEDDFDELKRLIENTFSKEFSTQEIRARDKVLSLNYTNVTNIQKIISSLQSL